LSFCFTVLLLYWFHSLFFQLQRYLWCMALCFWIGMFYLHDHGFMSLSSFPFALVFLKVQWDCSLHRNQPVYITYQGHNDVFATVVIVNEVSLSLNHFFYPAALTMSPSV
jgi:hypothetical protein